MNGMQSRRKGTLIPRNLMTKIITRLRLVRPARPGKVFGVGLPKTGTKTLGCCFKQLGFKHRSYDMDMAVQVKRGELEKVLAQAEKYETFEDWPWFLIYRELDQRFPNSKFVLTLRKDTESYGASLMKHHARQGIGRKDFAKPHWWDDVFGFAPDQWNYEKSIERYERHNRQVLEYFQDRTNDLLVVCWENGDGWDKLSEFLNKPCPDEPFPHLNISPI
jgi:hypothetical protein